MSRINRLQSSMSVNQLLITDPVMIFYYTGLKYDVGERFIGVYVPKEGEPTFFINKLFEIPREYNTIPFEDSDDITSILLANIDVSETLAVDGNCAAKFIIPLIDAVKLENASPYLEAVRNIKDSSEIEIMKEVSNLNDQVMESLKEYFIEGITEIELAEIIRKKQSTDPLTGVSFEPIALFSENIADPHGIPSERKLKKGDVIQIDMGGIYKGYCSDMTRCFFFGGNSELEKIYNIVLEANLNAIATVKPGIPLSEVDKAARSVIEHAGYGDYFVHRTGHGIGIECHENLNVSSTNKTIIREGMCFSIEPGIYIEGLGGIRIEDLICVTKDGGFVMNSAPKEFSMISL
ncbi:MAG: aminopeptidase P family protein [Erysipelothrix sp.]